MGALASSSLKNKEQKTTHLPFPASRRGKACSNAVPLAREHWPRPLAFRPPPGGSRCQFLLPQNSLLHIWSSTTQLEVKGQMPQTPLLWRWVENCPDTLSPSRGSPSLLLPFERVEVGVQPMLEEVTLCPLRAQLNVSTMWLYSGAHGTSCCQPLGPLPKWRGWH